ncbi:polyprenyl synthetase family protein [Acetivibrio mesophilus]|uniref:Polyprenyl synthetase family protein n=1 Tax=Acetivibrio mesophilus TaxID=2487273 RepID=A0A4Q0IAU0_9FIRM|nr:polyprenyl synthetase family protein [Acetivibrio mesophilus]ODM25606.1 trans-hexaprenyltranstransferase [Clostridium sp. Bc-iso-3]RXE60192.1 polyprenyl synthetase family protein [Acetivibrio mesophilus]HHV29044.1 polyprenyl synthetase family protein [Clostridium sp.]
MPWSHYPEIEEELILLEEFIQKNIRSRNQLINEAVNDIVQSGGKRLRPAFVILASQFGKYNRKKVIPAAAAIEILHTATLVHDDVIDRTKLRRGQVTVSEKFGMDMAVYVGDYLYTKAVLLLAGNVPEKKLGIIAKGVKAICEGEVDQYQHKYSIDTSVFTYLKRISRKTAVLFGAACALGADIANCSQKVAKSLIKFGFYYGMAFQIKDDINNYTKTQYEEEKPVGNDILEGIITLPVILGLRSKPDLKEDLQSFLNKRGNATEEEAAHVIELIKESGGIEQSRTLLNKYIERATRELQNLPDNKHRKAFERIVGIL